MLPTKSWDNFYISASFKKKIILCFKIIFIEIKIKYIKMHSYQAYVSVVLINLCIHVATNTFEM